MVTVHNFRECIAGTARKNNVILFFVADGDDIKIDFVWRGTMPHHNSPVYRQ